MQQKRCMMTCESTLGHGVLMLFVVAVVVFFVWCRRPRDQKRKTAMRSTRMRSAQSHGTRATPAAVIQTGRQSKSVRDEGEMAISKEARVAARARTGVEDDEGEARTPSRDKQGGGRRDECLPGLQLTGRLRSSSSAQLSSNQLPAPPWVPSPGNTASRNLQRWRSSSALVSGAAATKTALSPGSMANRDWQRWRSSSGLSSGAAANKLDGSWPRHSKRPANKQLGPSSGVLFDSHHVFREWGLCQDSVQRTQSQTIQSGNAGQRFANEQPPQRPLVRTNASSFERSAANDQRSLPSTPHLPAGAPPSQSPADETPSRRPRTSSFERMTANDRLPPSTPRPPARGDAASGPRDPADHLQRRVKKPVNHLQREPSDLRRANHRQTKRHLGDRRRHL